MCFIFLFDLLSDNFSSSFIKPRHRAIWSSCYSDLESSITPVSCYEIYTSNRSAPSLLPPIPIDSTAVSPSESVDNPPTPTPLLIIDTAFNPGLEANCSAKYNKKTVDRTTQTQRKKAEKALVFSTYDEFSKKVLSTSFMCTITYTNKTPAGKGSCPWCYQNPDIP